MLAYGHSRFTGADGEIVNGVVEPNVLLRVLDALAEVEKVFAGVGLRGSRKSRWAWKMHDRGGVGLWFGLRTEAESLDLANL